MCKDFTKKGQLQKGDKFKGYFVIHGTLWYKVLCDTRYFVTHGTYFWNVEQNVREKLE